LNLTFCEFPKYIVNKNELSRNFKIASAKNRVGGAEKALKIFFFRLVTNLPIIMQIYFFKISVISS
jgi:hypothetical protein